MLFWQVAERGAHQEGQPPMAGGDLVLRPLWEEDETVPGSDQGNVAFMGFFLGLSGNSWHCVLWVLFLCARWPKGMVGLCLY